MYQSMVVFKLWFNSLSTRAEFASSIDLDEVAHNEPPYLDLHCLPSSLLDFQYNIAWTLTFIENLQTNILSSALW